MCMDGQLCGGVGPVEGEQSKLALIPYDRELGHGEKNDHRGD